MSNLYERLAANFRTKPHATFAVSPHGRRFTYGDVETRSGQFAGALRELGVRAGDRVAVQAEKSLDMLMLYLGAVRAGAVFLPLNTAYTAAELAFFVQDAEPALFVVDPLSQEAAREIMRGATVETLGANGDGSLARLADTAPATLATVSRTNDDLAAILYTSGTTGRPKGAMLTHGNLASNAETLRDVWRYESSDVLLHALPIFHTHGLFVATNVTLAAGASMILLPRFDVGTMIECLSDTTVMMGVPTFYIRLLADARLDKERTAGMRLFISGSAPLSPDVHREFVERTGHAILERYGMTETNMNTSNPYVGRRVPGSVGPALPGVALRITDPETGEEVAAGTIGNIEIAGPNVFKGYWRQPEKTAADFHGDYFVSGDLGLIDGTGYVHIVGRAKDLIITGGYNVYPAEIEAALDELPYVRESAVIGVPHPDLGEGVVAVIVTAGPDRVDEALVRGALRDRLARFKLPRRVLLVAELPKNAMGKVQKNQLRESNADAFSVPV